ncbi:TPA: hypothetical protein ACF0M1_002341 [Enterococcus hirae]|uniref:Uncharacterized protein n=2 Tax=Enterococcus hirae TaxID=1354 RepID=G0YP69_ENTHA|nr:hypothetical protein [Enterococcus hirae]AEJ87189.1 hypothetical protein EHR_3026 [Enterococcus hirae ATCC 9790]EOH67498.1 hypothetical protein UAE_02727 [Enterococcus hirae ATCC 9790]EOU03356.1 hypothetical protein I584_02729 [Enterococcus hirae ATCC 9790]OJG49236.1 hypothetical protein RV05_GL001366 [Enterococcus hirae]QQY20808.1 hypothetical protein I6I80_00395 [Enterococcus hirae]
MNVLEQDLKFRYQLLGRMVQDVQYCTRLIKNAKEENREYDFAFILDNHLWGARENHFKTMRDILNSFSNDEQIDWYSLEEMAKDHSLLEELTGMSIG